MKEEIEKLIAELQAANVEDDAVFQYLVNRTIQVLSLDPQKDVGRRFGISVPSTQRWISGRTAPHPAMRPAVYNYFLDKAREKLNEGK